MARCWLILLAVALHLATGPASAEGDPDLLSRVPGVGPIVLSDDRPPEWTIESGRSPTPYTEWTLVPDSEWSLRDRSARHPALAGIDDTAKPLGVPSAEGPKWWKLDPPDRDWLALGDWVGLGRDTALLVAYQALGVGFFYILPESVSKWSQASKDNISFHQWWDNVQNPHWDKDEWWVNAGHAYFGAVYYIRARERGFGQVPSFFYSALASCLYEFGVEAVFERPSYQDIIITPVGGALLGAFVFEPIRRWVRAKPDLAWYDHVVLVATDPIGAANYVVERLFGIKSEIRVNARPPRVGQGPPSGAGGSETIGPQKLPRSLQTGVSVEMNMQWD